MAITTDRDLIEETLQDLAGVHGRLVQDRDRLVHEQNEVDQKIGDLEARIAKWRRQLSALQNGQGDGGPKTRRKKGEGVEIVRGVVEREPGLSMQEISNRAGIPWSSTRNALQKHPELFEFRDGAWYPKKEADEQ